MPEEGLTGDPRSQRSAHCLVHQVSCAVPAELRKALEKKGVRPGFHLETRTARPPCFHRDATVFSPRRHRVFTGRTRCSPPRFSARSGIFAALQAAQKYLPTALK